MIPEFRHVYERDGEWYAVPKPLPLQQVIRGAILNALAYTGGEQAAAARLLGVSSQAFNLQMGVYQIPGATARSRHLANGRGRRNLPHVSGPRQRSRPSEAVA